MKHIIITIISALLIMMSATTSSAQGKKDIDQFEVTVAGLGCPFCAYGLEKKLKDFKGLKKLKINMETGDVSFSYPASKGLSLTDVEYKVDNAGYTAVTTKVMRYDGTIEEAAKIAISDDVDLNNLDKSTLYVGGSCGMCQARINKAVKSVRGVADANWDTKTKILSFSYDEDLTSKDAIEDVVVTLGHDTQNKRAADETYDALPPCCHYDRVNNRN